MQGVDIRESCSAKQHQIREFMEVSHGHYQFRLFGFSYSCLLKIPLKIFSPSFHTSHCSGKIQSLLAMSFTRCFAAALGTWEWIFRPGIVRHLPFAVTWAHVPGESVPVWTFLWQDKHPHPSALLSREFSVCAFAWRPCGTTCRHCI